MFNLQKLDDTHVALAMIVCATVIGVQALKTENKDVGIAGLTLAAAATAGVSGYLGGKHFGKVIEEPLLPAEDYQEPLVLAQDENAALRRRVEILEQELKLLKGTV